MGKREKKTEQTGRAWMNVMGELIRGGVVALGTAVLVVLAASVPAAGGILGEDRLWQVVLAACVLGGLLGGLFAVRGLGGGSLPVGAGVGLILFLLLLSLGFLLYDEAALSQESLPILLACCCGGAVAGILGRKPRKKRKR